MPSITANAVLRAITVFTADAVLKKAHASNFTADAYIGSAAGFSATPNTGGYATVQVAQATGTTVSTLLYRYNQITSKWILVVALGINFTYVDFAAPLNRVFLYRVDNLNAANAVTASHLIACLPIVSDYWTLAYADAIMQLNVTDAPYERMRQSEPFAVLGSRYKVVQTGLLLGQQGTLSFHLSSAVQQATLRSLKTMLDTQKPMFIKSPFGEVSRIVMLSQDVTYLPTGHVTVTVPFVQVNEA